MSLNNVTGTTYSSALLIADTYQLPGGSNDSLPSFTRVNGFPVSACLELQSTLGALLVSRMSTAERLDLNACNGMLLYDEDLESFMFYEDGGWVGIPGVIVPTIVNNIATFNDTAGTIKDSGVRLLQDFDQQALFIGQNTGNLAAVSTSNNIVAIGTSTLPVLVAPSINSVCIGSGVGFHATGVDDCVFIGTNIASGMGSGHLSELIAIGSNALPNVVDAAARLTAIGYFSQNLVTTAARCTSVGWFTLKEITVAATAADSTAMGASCLASATTALRTTAYGSGAASGNLSYTDCTIIGENADNLSNALTGTTILGKGASANANNSTAIGINATVTTANSMALGVSGTKVGIGNPSPQAQLHIGYVTGAGSVILPFRIDTINTNITVTYDDYIVQGVQQGVTFTLPLADLAHAGQTFILKKANGSSGVFLTTVQTQGGQTIDGVSSQSSSSGWSYFRVYTDGSNWYEF